MFTVSANTVYSIEDGQHSLELSYTDSDGVNVGLYSTGESLEDVVADAVDQLEEAIAEFNDDRADMEESAMLEAKIAELQAQIDELSKENATLKARHEAKLTKINKGIDIDKLLNKIDKIDSSNFFSSKWSL